MPRGCRGGCCCAGWLAGQGAWLERRAAQAGRATRQPPQAGTCPVICDITPRWVGQVVWLCQTGHPARDRPVGHEAAQPGKRLASLAIVSQETDPCPRRCLTRGCSLPLRGEEGGCLQPAACGPALCGPALRGPPRDGAGPAVAYPVACPAPRAAPPSAAAPTPARPALGSYTNPLLSLPCTLAG